MPAKKVTKADLIEAVYRTEDVSKETIKNITDDLLLKLKENLIAGSTIELRGFGTLELRLRKGRSKARNPKTGEPVSVAPHYIAAFRAGQDLKQALLKLDNDQPFPRSPCPLNIPADRFSLKEENRNAERHDGKNDK